MTYRVSLFGWTGSLVLYSFILPVLCVALSSTSFAFQDDEEVDENDAITLAPRSLRREISEAQRDIESQRYAEAVETLGKILMENTEEEEIDGEVVSQDYFVNRRSEGLITGSIRTKAAELLESLPEANRELVEIRYGVTAQQLLDEAISKFDWSAIQTVSRQYFHTKAGYEATLLLARRSLTEGRPLSAALAIERLLKSKGAVAKYGPRLALFAASCWLESGRTDKALAVMLEGNKLFAGQTATWRGKEFAFAESKVWIESDLSIQARTALTPSLDKNWLIAGGNSQRNGESAAGLPMPSPIWQVPLTRGRPDEIRLRNYLEGRSPAAPALFPSAAATIIGNTIVYKTVDHALRGVNVETGKLQWEQSLSSSRWESSPQFFPMGMDVEATLPNNLANRVWGEVPFWQVSSDGEQIFIISQPSDRELEEQNAAQLRNRFQNFALMSQNINYLEACSLKGEGKWVWRVGGLDGEDEPKLAGAFFCGPPLPVEDQLYCVAEVNGETSLVVLDSETGALQWSQQLAQNPTANFADTPPQFSANNQVAYADGIVICPTGTGVVIAVDVASRTLRWAFRYRDTLQANMGRGMAFNQMVRREVDPLNERRWTGLPLTIANGKVLVASLESDSLMCLDLVSGELLWNQRREPYRFVAGIYDNKVLLVGDKVIAALNLSDGKLAWPSPAAFPDNRTVTGTGVRRGGDYFLPLDNQKILQINISTGELKGSTQTDVPLGNLFAFGEKLLSVSPFGMSLFYTQEDLQKQVSTRLANASQDPWTMARQSELLLLQNKQADSLQLLREAFKAHPDNEEIRYLMIKSILTAMNQDFATYGSMAAEIEPLIKLRPQRVAFLIAMTKGHLGSPTPEKALDSLIQLVDIRCQERQIRTAERNRMLDIELGHKVDIDLWIRSQLSQIFASQGSTNKTAMEQTIEAYLSNFDNEELPTKSRRLGYFTNISVVAPRAVEAAQQWIDRGTGRGWLEAETLLTSIAMNTALPASTKAQEQLIRLYQAARNKQGLQNLKAFIATRLQTEASSTDALYSQLTSDNAKATVWPTNQTKTELVAAENGMFRQVTAPAKLVQANSIPLAGFEVRDGSDRVVLVGPDGRDAMIVNCDSSESRIRTSEARTMRSFLVVQRKTEIVVIDTLGNYNDSREALLWKQELFPPEAAGQRDSITTVMRSNSLGMELPRVTLRGNNLARLGPLFPHAVIIIRGNTIFAHDIFTGKILWSVEGFGGSCEFASSEDKLVVLDTSSKARRVLNAFDGTEIESQALDADWSTLQNWKEFILDFKSDTTQPATEGPAREGTEKKVAIRLWNGVSGETVLQETFSANAKAATVLNRYLAVLEPSGSLAYWDLETGKKSSHQLRPISNLKHINLIPAYDRLLLLTDSSDIEAKDVLVEPESNTTRTLWVNGDVYALNLVDGAPLWEKPAELNLINISRQQSRLSPIVAFYRRLSWYGSSNRIENTSIALLDVRNGALVFASDQLVLPRNETTMVESMVEPFTVMAKHGNQMLKVTWTDQPAPAAEIAKFGEVSLAKLNEANQKRKNANGTGEDGFGIFEDTDPPNP